MIDLAMRNREISRYRAEIVPLARGVVVEIGIGSGLNLPYYSQHVTALHAFDPSEKLVRMAEKRMSAAPFPVRFAAHGAETLPLADACADSVVTTFTLCTIPDARKALAEAKRVLKPGGRLLVAEHGLAPDRSVRRWQARLNPVWRRIGGGCNLDRDIRGLIESAGFAIEALRNEYAKAPKPLGYMYVGCAEKR